MTDFACFYLSGTSLDLNTLEKVPGGVSISRIKNEWGEESFNLRFADFSLILTRSNQADIPKHLRGLSNFVLSKHFERPNPKTECLLDQISQVTQVVGCVINPAYDQHGYVGGALTHIASLCHSLLFTRDIVFDEHGEVIVHGGVPN